jgi:hypothetical protein
MKILNQITDHRINAINVLLETTIGEYNALANTILQGNEFQRKRFKSSATIYSLLKSDLKLGIVIPPIVLALSVELNLNGVNQIEIGKVQELLSEYLGKLIILDGLQRTYTIRDLIRELTDSKDPDLEKVKSYPLRIEIYLGISKIGVLYRMLTLNTGQTPMSSRHQIEIIYSDYIKEGIENIKLIKQVDGESPTAIGEYNFKDIIDGFTSYLEKDYLTIERSDILDNIKSLEKLASEQSSKDLFVQFVITFNCFVEKINFLGAAWSYNPVSIGKVLGAPPFAMETYKMFNRSQIMTGFGSAISKLISMGALKDFDEVKELITSIKSIDINADLDNLIIKLDDIRLKSKKIGNDQRLFFHYFFRELFDRQSDAFLNISEAIAEAFNQYERKTQ